MQARIERPAAPSRKRLLAAVGLTAATVAAFANSFNAGFPLDNKALILEDPRLREVSAENVALIFQHTYWWPHGEAGLYRPVATLSYWFNYAVLGNGENAFGYHCVNLLLHIACVLLFYALVSSVARAFWPAVFAAGLWAVHPIVTESVTNIVGRADLLSSAAVMAGLLLYLQSAKSAGGRRAAWLAALAVTASLAVFSKESGAIVPAVLVLYELTLGSRRWRALLLGLFASVIPLALMLYARAQVLAASAPASFPFLDNPIGGAGFWSGRATAIRVLGRYLALVVWPRALSTDYSYPEIPLVTGAAAFATIACGAVLAIAGALVLCRRNRAAFFFAGLAFLAFLPVSNLLFSTGAIMAERLFYLPAGALLALFAMGVFAVCERFGYARIAAVALALIAAALAARTIARNADWRDDVTLGRAAVESCPRSFKAHKILAAALLAAHAPNEEVLAEAAQSVALIDAVPDSLSDAAAYRLAATAYLARENRGGDARALSLLERCTLIVESDRARDLARASARGAASPALAPNSNDDAYRLLSLAQLRAGQVAEAIASAEIAREREPLEREAHRQLAHSLAAARRFDDAAIALMEGVFFTSDQSLRQDLLALYRSGLDPKGCAITPGPNGPALNPSCESVHRDLCRASADAIALGARTGRDGIANGLRQSAVLQLGCGIGN